MENDTPVTIIYTSGTSGEAKGVVLTAGNVGFMLDRTAERLSELMAGASSGVTGQDRIFHYLPFTFAASDVYKRQVEESPVFDPLFEKYGSGFAEYLREKVEVVEGDVTQAGLGLNAEVARRLQKNLDVIVNSSGLTDFNPDLRDALATNTDAAMSVLEFVRGTEHAGLRCV